jgi:hypothetical protein
VAVPFRYDRLEGLGHAPRPGDLRTITDEQVEPAITNTLATRGRSPYRHRSTVSMAAARPRPKLRPVRQAISGLNWCFAGSAGRCSGYFKGERDRSAEEVKAWRWVLVGSVSIGTVTWVPVNRTWLRVRVARCSSRPRKLPGRVVLV